MVILLSTKCFLFVYIYIDLLKLKAYKQFENNVKWYWSLLASFLKKPTCDTPTYVTWRSLPSNQFVLEIVSTLPCASGLIRHKLLFVYFFKELISFIGSLDECHTSDWLIERCFMPISTVYQLYHSDSSHFICLSCLSPVLSRGSEGSCTRTLQWKNPEDSVRFEPKIPGLRLKHSTTETRRTPVFKEWQ